MSTLKTDSELLIETLNDLQASNLQFSYSAASGLVISRRYDSRFFQTATFDERKDFIAIPLEGISFPNPGFNSDKYKDLCLKLVSDVFDLYSSQKYLLCEVLHPNPSDDFVMTFVTESHAAYEIQNKIFKKLVLLLKDSKTFEKLDMNSVEFLLQSLKVPELRKYSLEDFQSLISTESFSSRLKEAEKAGNLKFFKESIHESILGSGNDPKAKSKLFRAIKKHDVQLALRMLEKGAEITDKSSGLPPLFFAMRHKSYELVHALRERYPQIEEKSRAKLSLSQVKKLDLSSTYSKRLSSLEVLAFFERDVDVFQREYEKLPKACQSSDDDFQTALRHAMFSGNTDVAKYLASKSEDADNSIYDAAVACLREFRGAFNVNSGIHMLKTESEILKRYIEILSLLPELQRATFIEETVINAPLSVLSPYGDPKKIGSYIMDEYRKYLENYPIMSKLRQAFVSLHRYLPDDEFSRLVVSVASCKNPDSLEAISEIAMSKEDIESLLAISQNQIKPQKNSRRM